MDDKKEFAHESLGSVEDLTGIRQEIAELWGRIAELDGGAAILGFVPGQSGDVVPEVDGLGYEAKLRQARTRGDMVAALRIKQEAAKVGLVLI